MDIPIDISLECGKCGGELEGPGNWRHGGIWISVTPCQVCIDAARNRGLDEGWDNRYAIGKEGGEHEIK